jgi:hypothetical protein
MKNKLIKIGEVLFGLAMVFFGLIGAAFVLSILTTIAGY